MREIRYSEGERANVRCYGAADVREGVAIAHVEMMGFLGMGNNPMVGATVAVAVAVAESLK